MRTPSDILDLAARQHGVISIRQITELGHPRHLTHRRIRGGQWTRLSPAVIRIAGSADTVRQRTHAALLDAGPCSAVSHESALALWGVTGFGVEPLNVTRRRTQSPRRRMLATVHQPRALSDDDLAVLDDLRVVTPVRALFDVAGTRRHHGRWIERTLDTMWAMGIVDHHTLDRSLHRLAERGRSGIVLMRELIEARSADHRPPESGLEARFGRLMRLHNIDGFKRQVDIGGSGWLGRVDFVHTDTAVVVQIDNSRFHGSLIDQRADSVQTEALAAAGWHVVRVGEGDLWRNEAALGRRIRSVILSRSDRAA